MANNKSFDDVQVFFNFKDILDEKNVDLRKDTDKKSVDLLSNLDPEGKTNTAIELAKIYSWYTAMIDFTQGADGKSGTITIKEEVIPDSVKGAVTEGHLDEDGNFVDSEGNSIEGRPGTVYVDTENNTTYRYDEDTEEFVSIDNDTKYDFKEGNTAGTFQFKEDGSSWQDIHIKDVATLENGKVPASQLPSYVDDVLEGYFKNEDKTKFYKDEAGADAYPNEAGKIYVDLKTNKTYRWSGSQYTEISESLALGETHDTAFYGDHGKTAYEHSQKHGSGQVTESNPHGMTAKDIGLSKDDIKDALGYEPAKNESFTPPSESAAGSAGLVPAPQTGDKDKFLKGDGTWSDAPVVEGNILILHCNNKPELYNKN